MTVRLIPPQWYLQPFERELAIIEAERLASVPVTASPEGFILQGPVGPDIMARLARRLSFARL